MIVKQRNNPTTTIEFSADELDLLLNFIEHAANRFGYVNPGEAALVRGLREAHKGIIR